ncbi:saccharopine dehydrogenase [Grosmannia clavigera kw1407]|uniref:Saccharopine dehydrogenase n=1 Tax=Grosmannia clavigera (strain kw1407 / UAMH 11150) TaxID=655863 RepID=F0XS73_GROCL|nr:saccharopine dehydrogenase [Grosmannia clavigera kw1407]EFW99401.1 saccharopine dehydrogenase [Grosmannia clavigera kw1407]
MTLKTHDRPYDIVVFGASGYTGACVAEHITASLPTTLKWALAGRSHDKLTRLAAQLKELNADRNQPAIEIVAATDEDLDKLAKKTFVLITTVGPYIKYGEPAFRACAQNGTHYFDVTGEVPFSARMIRKYEAAAKQSGAIMLPQCGIESAPADLVTWMVAKTIRQQLKANTADVTVAMAAPSGGTLNTVFTGAELVTLKELRETMAPFALSPVLKNNPTRGQFSILQLLTGIIRVPNLGLLTTALAGSSDAALVERTWGLLSSTPSREQESYGPNFSFCEYARVRSRLQGFIIHWGLAVGSVLLFTLPPLRWLARRFVYQPGEGATKEQSKRDRIECRAIGNPDFDVATETGKPRQQAFGRVLYKGSIYALTGALVAEGALTVLEDDVRLDGGIYTAALLGQGFIDRLEKAGVEFEAKVIDVSEQ